MPLVLTFANDCNIPQSSYNSQETDWPCLNNLAENLYMLFHVFNCISDCWLSPI